MWRIENRDKMVANLRTERQLQADGPRRRFTLGAVVLGALILLPLPSDAAPLLLSHFKFNGSGEDSLGNSPPMALSGVMFTNETLATPQSGGYAASARVAGFSYSSFTVAFDFRPYDFGFPNQTLLSGGPSYRWIGFENDSAGHLLLTLNNRNRLYNFTNVVATHRWHTLVCSVDLISRAIVTVLDGERLPDIALQNFQFNVIGTAFEQSDQVFSFWNYGNATGLYGQADNLRIYSRALSGSEIQSLHSPRIGLSQSGQGALIHWSADLTGYVAETATSLLAPVQWVADGRTPVFVGDRRVLVDPLATGPRFYRLRRF